MSTDVTPSTMLKASVAEEIRALLGRRNMSKLQLAQRIDRSHTYMWRRLSGEVAFDLDDLERIADVFGVKVGDLVPRRYYKGDTETFLPRHVTPRTMRPRPTIGASRRPADGRPPGRPTTSSRPDGLRRASRIA